MEKLKAGIKKVTAKQQSYADEVDCLKASLCDSTDPEERALKVRIFPGPLT